ncbi:hypothetical protein [Nonomuraea sp. B1E8]|uniref:hypothetical protein n=1 Tax=unclassified Nonomuraea TaxID=2593643 RepID=UPI00325EAEAE
MLTAFSGVKEDFTRSAQKCHLVPDNIANRSLSACQRVLAPRGTFVPGCGSGGPRIHRGTPEITM